MSSESDTWSSAENTSVPGGRASVADWARPRRCLGAPTPSGGYTWRVPDSRAMLHSPRWAPLDGVVILLLRRLNVVKAPGVAPAAHGAKEVPWSSATPATTGPGPT